MEANGGFTRATSDAAAHVPPRLTFAMELQVKVGAPLDVGAVPRGRRRIVPIEVGSFEGPNLRGTVLPGGADWQIIRGDGLAELDTRYTLKTEAGDVIYIQNAGMRHAPPDLTGRLLADRTSTLARVFRTGADVRDASPASPVADARDLRRHRRAAPHRRDRAGVEGGMIARRAAVLQSSQRGALRFTMFHASRIRTSTPRVTAIWAS